MSGIVWIPGAERLGSGSIGGAMDSPGKPPRSVWHTTESGAGDAAFDAVAEYLIDIPAEPHVLYDPTTDRIGQYGPLNQSARALRNDGSTRTNRTGKVCIQIEVLARAGTPFTGYWKPGKNFRALMAAIRSWGVPERFPLPLAGSYGSGIRTREVWLNEGGHYGHCNVPGNDHWDPGKLDTAALFAAGKEEEEMEAKDVWGHKVKVSSAENGELAAATLLRRIYENLHDVEGRLDRLSEELQALKGE